MDNIFSALIQILMSEKSKSKLKVVMNSVSNEDRPSVWTEVFGRMKMKAKNQDELGKDFYKLLHFLTP